MKAHRPQDVLTPFILNDQCLQCHFHTRSRILSTPKFHQFQKNKKNGTDICHTVTTYTIYLVFKFLHSVVSFSLCDRCQASAISAGFLKTLFLSSFTPKYINNFPCKQKVFHALKQSVSIVQNKMFQSMKQNVSNYETLFI